jgi:hypothetical protein
LLKRAVLIGCALLSLAAPLFSQDSASPEELRRRVEELEKKVADLEASRATPTLDELKRQIDVLASEIEKLQQEKSAAPSPVLTATAPEGTSATKVYRSGTGVSIGGYGEMLYQNFSGRQQNGVPSERIDQVDLLRGVLYTGYRFSDRALFNSELEVEHAHVEGDHGEVSLEFAYLDFLLRPWLNIRGGKILVPVGIINETHEPTTFLGSRRTLVERLVIPATWGEPGVGVYGDAGALSYRAYLVTGLDSSGFSGDQGIREGRQDGSEATAQDFALTGRLDWHPIEGTVLGGSLYAGRAGQGRHTADAARLRAPVTLGELHVDSRFRSLSLRGLWAEGRVGEAAEINALNGLSGDESIGSQFGGWYGEAGYDIGSLLQWRAISVTPFLRYEQLNTQKEVPEGFLRSGANDQRIATLGLVWKPIPQTAMKLDWQRVRNRARSGVNQFNLSMGYIF